MKINDKYGDARFATKADIKEMKLLNPKNSNGFILERIKGKRIESPVCRHSIVVAPTRSGKTAGFVIPNILNYQGSMIVIDPKGELYDMTAQPLRKRL